jgi:hypothetical protein
VIIEVAVDTGPDASIPSAGLEVKTKIRLQLARKHIRFLDNIGQVALLNAYWEAGAARLAISP